MVVGRVQQLAVSYDLGPDWLAWKAADEALQAARDAALPKYQSMINRAGGLYRAGMTLQGHALCEAADRWFWSKMAEAEAAYDAVCDPIWEELRQHR